MRSRITVPGIVTIVHLALTTLVVGLATLGHEMMQRIFDKISGTEGVFYTVLTILMIPLGIILPMGFGISSIAGAVIFAVFIGLNSTLVGYVTAGIFLWIKRLMFDDKAENE